MPLFRFSRSAPRSHFGSALRRLLVCACALILALQLVGTSFHDHDLAEQLSDCVSCQVASHAKADLPAVSPQLLAIFLAIAYLLARLPRPAPIQRRQYLIPMPQAPPRHQCVH